MLLLLAVLVLGSPPRPHAQAAPSAAATLDRSRPDLEARRARVLAIAASYADHVWRAGAANRLHGPDPDGVEIDTPDADFAPGGWNADGAENRGVPYAWGGFSSLEEFDRGLATGRYAGNWPRTESSGASAWTVGVDCSGFLSRCWELPRKQSTRSLGALCYELADYSELRPGDLINSFDGHAVLFLEHLGPERLRVVEAGNPKVCESEYALADLRKRGMRPMRYKPLDERWRTVPRSATAFELAPAGDGALPMGRFEVAPSADEWAAPAAPLADARLGEWARYRSSLDSAILVRQIANVAVDGIELQIALEDGGARMDTSEPRTGRESTLELLQSFDLSHQRLSEVVPGEVEHERGTWTAAGREFAAWRTRARVQGTWIVRHQRYPVELEIELVHSDEVPVEGLLWAELRYVFGNEGERRESRSSYELAAFGN